MYSIRNLLIGYGIGILVVLLVVWNLFSTLQDQKDSFANILKAREVLQRLQPAIMNLQELETTLADGASRPSSHLDSLLADLRKDSVNLVRLGETRKAYAGTYQVLSGLLARALSGSLPQDSLERLVARFRSVAASQEAQSRDTLSTSYDHSVALTRRTVAFVSIISGVLVFLLIYGFFFTYRDITNRQRYSEQLRKFNEELEHQVIQKTRVIRKNEERYKALVENAPEALVVFDVEKKQFVSVSESALKLFKMSREDMLRSGPIQLSPPYQPDGRPSGEAASEKIQEAIRGGKPVFEWMHQDAEGRSIPCEVWLVRLPDTSQVLIRGSIIDISARKESEAALRESEAKYRAFFETSMDGILLTIPDGRVLAANPAACQILGMTEAEICQSGRFGLVDATDPNLPYLIRQRELLGRAAGELTFIRKDGSRFTGELTTTTFTNAAGEKRSSIIFRDISEKKKFEKELREAESMFRSLAERSLVGIYILQEGRYAYVNPRFAEIFGYTPQDLMQNFRIDTIINPDDRELVAENIRARIEGEVDSIHYEVSGIHKDGSRLFLEIFGSRFQYAGKPAIIGTLLDITERKLAEQQIRDSLAEIRQLTEHLQDIREEERAHMAREIHDELGQYLTVLKMDVSWLNNHLRAGSQETRRKLEGLTQLIDETVKTVRRIASELRPSLLDDLGLVAAMDWHLHEFEARTGIRTEFRESGADLPLANPVKTGLFRIFQESLTNVARHAGASRVTVELQAGQGELTLRVQDDGKGFNPETIRRKKTLGLLGMKERCSMLRGSYELFSLPGQGTTITARIPLDGAASAG
ncbi:MAG TPA: PAS domain S-box protein [Chitinophagaceae bacterium]|nr:PAS domain S-box protein [Chitinophagaceae bacterium]